MMIREYEKKLSFLYENNRQLHQKEYEARKREIEKVIPEVSQIDKEISRLCIELSLCQLRGNKIKENDINNFKNKITDLRVKKSELLVSKGYEMDYLEMQYTCSKCKDTGYIGTERCSCYKNNLVKIYYNNSDLKDLILEDNFNTFNLQFFSSEHKNGDNESPRSNMKKILGRALSFIKGFKDNYENILFYGNSGTGKTFLSACIAKELLDMGYLVIYKTSEELISDLRKVRFENDNVLYDNLVECDLLVIDDLGTEQMSDFSKTELFNILNTKLLKKKRMLISTNLSLDEMMRTYSERLTSRLMGNFSLFKFYGEDLRILKNIKKIK